MSLKWQSHSLYTPDRLMSWALSSLLDGWEWNDREADARELETSLACRRLLLESGADPTAEEHDKEYTSGAWLNAMYAGTEVNLVSACLEV